MHEPTIVEITQHKGTVCRAVLETLPDWFGIPASVDDYVREVETLTMFAAMVDGDIAGIVSVRRHFDAAGEIYVMGVRPALHRRGLGRALVRRAETLLLDEGRAFMTVKTLSPSRPDEHYDRTREFYTSVGFRMLEELPTLWDERNPCLIMLKPLTDAR